MCIFSEIPSGIQLSVLLKCSVWGGILWQLKIETKHLTEGPRLLGTDEMQSGWIRLGFSYEQATVVSGSWEKKRICNILATELMLT